MLPYDAAALAHAIETEELKLESGVQDQYAAAYGGISHMDISYPVVQISQIRLLPAISCQLESRWVLVYLGSRISSDMHLQVIKRFQEGDDWTIQAHHRLKELAADMVWALQKGDVVEIARIMNENWAAQQQLHPAISNNNIQKLESLAHDCGAVGFKVIGAGGGGSAVIMAGSGKDYLLKKQLLDEKYIIFPCMLNYDGLQVWTER